jgi:phospho-N-acetylmuramoyl-pentapeptide-transferase
MLRLIFALLLSVVAMLVITPRVLPLLRKLKIGQTVYELGPESHKTKQGTPTMGGLIFALVTTVIALALHLVWYSSVDFGFAIIVFALLSMLIGFVDDYIKVVKKRNLGLVWWQKVIAQVVIGIAFSLFCALTPAIGTKIVIPVWNVEWDLGIWYVPVMTAVIVFIINSANLQDGLDGLLASVESVGAVAWATIALLGAVTSGSAMFPSVSSNYANVALVSLTLAGACIGFLWFNFHPAKVFMGDTGSMFIGGATVAIAMVLRMPILLLMIAATMIASSLSVIIQRAYFKATHGKRIFKMSPIHHHFEKSGMTEPQIVAMYTAVTGVLSIAAVLSLL